MVDVPGPARVRGAGLAGSVVAAAYRDPAGVAACCVDGRARHVTAVEVEVEQQQQVDAIRYLSGREWGPVEIASALGLSVGQVRRVLAPKLVAKPKGSRRRSWAGDWMRWMSDIMSKPSA